MPELPDITVYIEALERRILGRPVERIALRSAFVLRTVEPPITEAEGRTVAGLRRLGKRIVLDLGDGLFLAIHLMIAGRPRWPPPGAREAALRGLARGGIDVLAATRETFAMRLRSESHTLKRALTDPRLFSGIGNAYSDEILHAARLSPLALTGRLTDTEV